MARAQRNRPATALQTAVAHAARHMKSRFHGLQRLEDRLLLAGNVVINEIHYNPNIEYEAVEFIELTNAGDAIFDLSGAQFTDGIDYTFPAGTTLAPGAFLLVAQNPADVLAKWGKTSVGPWTGKLSNEGEKITLKSAGGVTLDTVTYGVGFPWPVTGEYGDSIELINPTLDNSIPGNWRQSNFNPTITAVAPSSSWRYRKGISEPSASWKNESFNEASDPVGWQTGTTPIGYGDAWNNTTLSDMQNGYSTVYGRKTFQIAGPVPDRLTLRLFLDDGGIVYINGTEVSRLYVTAGSKAYNSNANDHEPNPSVWDVVNLTGMSRYLHLGTNTLAIHALNQTRSSNDFTFDAELLIPAGQYGTSPGAQNTVFANSTPPLLDNLVQSVQQPVSGQDVKISVRATDSSGIQSVNLEYQLVEPGAYIRRTDAAYQNWNSVPMHDDGLNGDTVAGDGIYAYVMPASLQTHRRLVRYRIRATDNTAASVVAPYATDTQPNFAYYVYDGVPSWTGSNSATEQAYTFGTQITRSLATYQLLAVESDVVSSQYSPGYDGVDFYGTLVYDGVVYDHILFSNRGESSTYVSGKNKWKFNFNEGHLFAARDNYGNLYSEKWSRLNLNANATPWLTVHRGMAGLDESISYRLYQLAGMAAPNTNYVQFRVVDAGFEAPFNQYSGDMWGLYLAVENTGGHFLDEHGLEDGNVYKIEGTSGSEGGIGDARNISPDQVSDGSDWTTFWNTIRNTVPTLDWWRTNVNLDDSYSFQALNRVVSNIDLRPGWNHVMYHDPDGHWRIIPWDMDNILVPETHREGYTYLIKAVQQYAELQVEYANRARELLDLMFSDKSLTGGQVAQLVNEYARFVNPWNGTDGFLTGWAELDQYMWNYNPRTSTTPTLSGPNSNQPQPVHRGSFYVNPQYNWRVGGQWFRTLATPDFSGMVKYITDFMTDTDPDAWSIGDGDQRGYGYNYLEYDANDILIPNTPTVTYSGLNGFPSDKLKFNASPFSDPNSSPFAAMEWRIGEISNPSKTGFNPNGGWKYEIQSVWESGELSTYASQVSIPSGILQEGHTYRLRVRFKDNTGRWSHWSNTTAGVTEFVAGQPLDLVQNSLRITEINYNPVDNTVLPGNSPSDKENYEFIEFRNVGTQTISLVNLEFTEGIDMVFGDVTLEPGEIGVVTRNTSAFQSRYGTTVKVLGTYAGDSLSNGGERLLLLNSDDSILMDFTYDDTGTGWYPSTDGTGPSLVVRNPASNPNLSDAASWRASYVVGGSPGIDETHAQVVGRHTFYNYSAYDGYDAAASAADDAAIAPDKAALLPGQTASFANYTTYSQGLNGIMVDLLYFTGTITPSDFIFRVGNDDHPANWALAPDIIMLINRSLPGGITRVYIVWDNNNIQNQWLQITLKGGQGSNSGLLADDIFYFGNSIGDTGNSTADAQVNAIDEIKTRISYADLTGIPAANALINLYDFNRDRLVNADDEEVVGTHYTFFLNALKLISAPVAPLADTLITRSTTDSSTTVSPVATTPSPVTSTTSPLVPVFIEPTPALIPQSAGPAPAPAPEVKVVTKHQPPSETKPHQREKSVQTRTLKTEATRTYAGLKKSAWRFLFNRS